MKPTLPFIPARLLNHGAHGLKGLERAQSWLVMPGHALATVADSFDYNCVSSAMLNVGTEESSE